MPRRGTRRINTRWIVPPTIVISVGREMELMIEPPFPADPTNPYVFVSYAHADADRVYPILKR